MIASEFDKLPITEEPKATGLDSGNAEAIGHNPGKAIIEILHKKKADLTEENYHQTHHAISCISRRKAQEPKSDEK